MKQTIDQRIISTK